MHPVVRTHPVTGKKALYVNRGFTRAHPRHPGATRATGILAYLYEHMANPLFQCRFRWQANTIAFWDNRCAQHRAMWDYWPHTPLRQPRDGEGRPAGQSVIPAHGSGDHAPGRCFVA